ncbi:MAG TPA: hypothetical protein ENJ46_00145 [Hellea balneolensis]|uniref:DUF2157 domain-containing protein n=1 Tax=Hellea balneolensis TaxID=287478 RepID=A0A7C3C4D3_9PROT|nr:hypothetical protein [Hellea balneolensis]
MTPKQIDAALEAGIIDAAQAKALRAKVHTAKPEQTTTPDQDAALIGNEEDMRFVRSFSDVFIAMGIGLLSLGLFALCTLLGGGLVYLLGAGGLWMMAEYFGRHKRVHLPTLLIALAFLFFVHTGAASIIHVFPAIITLGAMLVFYWRFKLPFSIALIAISIVMLVFNIVFQISPKFFAQYFGAMLLLSGLTLFATALMYDAKDTGRLTRFADNAFWLHFTAAPLILHGIGVQILSLNVVKLLNVIPVPSLGKTDAMIMLLIIAVLALIGLAINRRALLVSSFGYAGFSIAMLIKDTGLDVGTVLATTLLLLGGGIVFLGAGWHGARRALLKVLPTHGVFEKVFPPAR